MMTIMLRYLSLIALSLGLFMGLGFFGASATARPSLQNEAVTLRARLAYEGVARPGRWVPVLVELENAGPDQQVVVQVQPNPSLAYATTVELPNQARKTLTVYAYLPTGVRRLQVQVSNATTELARQSITVPPIDPRTHLVALVGPAASALRIPERFEHGQPLQTVAFAPTDLPAHPLGLSAFDTLILADVATADLQAPQLQALEGWVLRGGQLLLSGGPGLAQTLAGLPTALRPVQIVALESLPASTLDAQAAGTLPFTRLRPTDVQPPAYTVPVAGLPYELRALEQTVGAGRVTVATLPLEHPTLLAWERAPHLWADLLRPVLALPPGFAPEAMTADSFFEENLASTLTALPALQLPPLGALAALMLGYIALVGPGTYLVLRRLDRLSLGWVVVPSLTLVFALFTYGIGYAQRGGNIVINQVTLIEIAASDPLAARTRSFIGLFSPTSQTYSLDASAADSLAPLMRPTSLNGPWATGEAGGGQFVQDVPPGAQIHDFTVRQWSMRTMMADTTTDLGPIRAEVSLDGDQLAGLVQNTSDLLLQDVVVIRGNQMARLGDLPPGAQSQTPLEVQNRPEFMGFGDQIPVSSLIYGDELLRQSEPGSPPISATIQQRIRILDTLFSYGPSFNGGHPLVLAWADTSTLALTPQGERTETQRLALVLLTPQVTVAPGPIELNYAWLAPHFEADVTSVCFGNRGPGVMLMNPTATFQLTVPRDLYGLQLEQLQLIPSADGGWNNQVELALYAWDSASWQPQPINEAGMLITDPVRFFGPHGTVRVRLSSPDAPINTGCFYVETNLSGVIP